MEDYVDEQALANLKEKIDALVQKGFELSKELSVDERYNMMKKVILEGIGKSLLNTTDDFDNGVTEEEFVERKDELIDFVRKYFEEKFSESLAMEWDETNRKA